VFSNVYLFSCPVVTVLLLSELSLISRNNTYRMGLILSF